MSSTDDTDLFSSRLLAPRDVDDQKKARKGTHGKSVYLEYYRSDSSRITDEIVSFVLNDQSFHVYI